MKNLLLPLLCSLALAFPARAEQFSIPGSGVTFDAPEGFTSLSKDEIGIKFPKTSPPGLVVGNERRTTTIAYDLKPQFVPIEKLSEAKISTEKLMERMSPGIVWKERKIIEFQGQPWIYFEMTSHAVDTDIHNIMLATPWKGKLLIFNFNSTREEFPKLESRLKKSIQTIRLNE